MSSAPICYINPPPPSAEPVAPTIPAIPVATDLASLINAVNIMRQIIQGMTNQISNGPGGRITDLTVTPGKKKNSNFNEIVSKRVYKTTTIKDKNSSASVDVKQITGLTFKNPITGQEIFWSQ